MSPPPALVARAEALKAWLFDLALPIWWSPGADRNAGGFHDRLSADGESLAGPKRARVTARQVFAFQTAAAMGWRGAADAAIDHGLDFLLAAHRRPDGLYRAVALAADDRVDLYDQAFVLLAFASAAAAGRPGMSEKAESLLGLLSPEPGGGFPSLSGAPLDANPNMHLLEAFMAWMALDAAGPWRRLAAGQVRLAVDRLIDPATGAQSEGFGPGWSAPATSRRAVWPGHQFEWAFLLLHWAQRAGDAAAIAPALRLIAVGERAGVDTARHVAINALDGNLQVTDSGTRLWPQTERLRAVLRAAQVTGDPQFWALAEDAVLGLGAFLDVRTPGLWRDSLESDDLSAPASSLYHLVGAIRELDAAALRTSRGP